MKLDDYDKEQGAAAFCYLLLVYSRRLEDDHPINGSDLVDDLVYAYHHIYKDVK